MKMIIKLMAIFILFSALALAACGGDETTFNQQAEGFEAGDVILHNADGEGFMMVYVPAKTFKTGTNDAGTATIDRAFWIGETEVTYRLWYNVRIWAIANGYTFANNGNIGDGTGDTALHPVTSINWRDAMVWCNALTEWYNGYNSTNYSCVYKTGGVPVRDSNDTNAAVCDAVIPDTSADGFRLLTSNEWELAARYVNDANNDGDICDLGEYYPGSYASGAVGDYTNSLANNPVAWFSAFTSSTHAVKELLPNALGIYDMSGNAYEWCFDLNGSDRIIRGGSWNGANFLLQVGYLNDNSPSSPFYDLGLRIARSEQVYD